MFFKPVARVIFLPSIMYLSLDLVARGPAGPWTGEQLAASVLLFLSQSGPGNRPGYSIVYRKNPAGRLARRPAGLFGRLARRPKTMSVFSLDKVFVYTI